MPQPIEPIITESPLLAEAIAGRQRELLRRIERNERRAHRLLMRQLREQPPRVARRGVED